MSSQYGKGKGGGGSPPVVQCVARDAGAMKELLPKEGSEARALSPEIRGLACLLQAPLACGGCCFPPPPYCSPYRAPYCDQGGLLLHARAALFGGG